MKRRMIWIFLTGALVGIVLSGLYKHFVTDQIMDGGNGMENPDQNLFLLDGDGIRQKIRYSLLFCNFLKLHHFVRRFRPVHRQLQSAAVLAGPGTVVNVQNLPPFRAVRLLENTVV